ncbi:hypothetical protein ABT275_23645 [Streptomyces sp. NPDC001185]|uniref:hypothetical protein n=1 Tax=Streptomyces sp. NPDC001185 TaxID=3154380 RepID=UPI003320DE00
MPTHSRLLRVGDMVRFDGRLHTVVALEGTAVRLVDEAVSASVVLLPHLLMSDGFEVVTAASPRMTVPASGVLESFPRKAVERAEWWQRHLVEVLTGRPAHVPDGPVKTEYDPQVRSLRQRELAKAAELEASGTAVSLTVLQDPRRYIAVCPEVVAATAPYASPHWRKLARSEDSGYLRFRTEFIRQLPQERILCRSSKPWFLKELGDTALRIEDAIAADAASGAARSSRPQPSRSKPS